MQMAKPLIRRGHGLGEISTLRTIWKVLEPMDWAASMMPLSTSLKLPSTMRAT